MAFNNNILNQINIYIVRKLMTCIKQIDLCQRQFQIQKSFENQKLLKNVTT